jgi:hypothetical protein
MKNCLRTVVGDADDWKGGISLILLSVVLILAGFTIGVLGRSSFVGMAGPATQPSAVIISLALSVIIAYRYHSILIAWISGLAIFSATALHYVVIQIQAETPLTFIQERLLMLIVAWGILFSSIGWIIGQSAVWLTSSE